MLGNAHGLEEIFKQDCSGVNWGHILFHEVFPLVTINYSDVIGIPILSHEADVPLIAHADAALALSASGQLPGLVGHRFADGLPPI